MTNPPDPERERLRAAHEDGVPWRRWGPHLADRQWGTVREDYSADGQPWAYFPHDQARSRAYRWGEDGLLGICDDQVRLCFALALWNGRDPILKERLFGLSGPEGNHGEDVKEAYFYLDATPTASYLRALYKYPLDAFPYQRLVEENAARSKDEREFELVDTGIFGADRYVDVEVEYAKAAPDDIAIVLSVTNRSADPASIDLLPTLWFRNTWSWGTDDRRPIIRPSTDGEEAALAGTGGLLRAEHHRLGAWWLAAEGEPEILVTENESNVERLWGGRSRTAAVKDGFHDALINGDRSRIAADPSSGGTKAAMRYRLDIPPSETRIVRLRLSTQAPRPIAEVDLVRDARRREADVFYAAISPGPLTDDERLVQRQAFAGLVWGKQSYHYDVALWLAGDASSPEPPASRAEVRNADWREFNGANVISMPDPWEYPWFAAWDLAFHAIPLALTDPEF